MTPRNRSDSLRRVRLLGLDFVDADDVADVVQPILSMADRPWRRDDHELPVVITPNVDHMVRLDQNGDTIASEIAERASVVLPDGQPVVWASRLLGDPLSARLPGSTLVDKLWPRIVADRRRALVIASTDNMTERIRHDGDSVDAITAPMLDLGDPAGVDAFVDRCIERAGRGRSEFVFVTLAFPKSFNVVARLFARWPDDQPLPVVLSVGASFEMYFGVVPRAPAIMQRLGLEWLFRFALEPRRLFPRYFLRGPVFIVLIVREWRRRRAS